MEAVNGDQLINLIIISYNSIQIIVLKVILTQV